MRAADKKADGGLSSADKSLATRPATVLPADLTVLGWQLNLDTRVQERSNFTCQ
jgi:hypothetical protein